MIRPKPGQLIPTKPGSRKLVVFVCDCGREKEITWKNYTTNHTKSCGLCRSDKYLVKNLKDKLFGKLRLANQELPQKIGKRTKLKWVCKCGNTKEVVAGSVVMGLTKSCGCLLKQPSGIKYHRPILLSKDHWLKTITELIDRDLPDRWSHKSGIKCWFLCGCGAEYHRRFFKWTTASTCGKCAVVSMQSIVGRQYGSLTVSDTRKIDIHLGSESKIEFKCSCGNVKMIKIGAVTRGYTTTCGRCNERSPEWWLSQNFGHLKVVECQTALSTGSESKLKCRCSCGNICYMVAYELTSGHVGSCGSCYASGCEWWATKQSPLRRPKFNGNRYPLSYLLDYFDGSYLTPLESPRTADDYCLFRCKLCGSKFKTKLGWVWHSKIVSCGCGGVHVSRANMEIGEYIKSLGFDAMYGNDEHCINGYKYDVYVPEVNLVIEHDGLRYHSDMFGRTKPNREKLDAARSANNNFLAIFEDEWTRKRSIFQSIIKNKLGVNKPSYLIRPQKCQIEIVDGGAVKGLLNSNHYIGFKPASYYVVVSHGGNRVACMLLSIPTRQKSGDWEISRMVCDSDYRIYGLWTYILKWLRANNIISGKIVSFSDNRLSDGAVYKHMGFTCVGDVRPDYYWVKNNRRYHKSSLRKREGEKYSGKTEVELRNAQGYYRIFDYGKVKWEIVL